MKISTKPANECKSRAVSAPNQKPTETMAIMRMMFKTAKTKKPRTNNDNFLKIEVEATKAKKAANIAKAINEYIPEQGMSTAKITGFSAAVDSKIVGDPYEEESVTGNPTVFNVA